MVTRKIGISFPLWLGVIFVIVVMGAAGFTLAHEQQRTSDVALLATKNASLDIQQKRAIEYLCETINIFDIIILQESQEIKVRLKIDKTLTRNEQERLQNRNAILQVAHFELTDQRACRNF
jgi:hypothetical protein